MFRPDCVRRAITYAEAERADHVVLLPRVIMKRPGEKMMVGFFQLLFVFGHRPWKCADPKARDHMGVGAFNLVRRTAYETVGTYERLRFEVVDDMKLGKVIKEAGFRQRVVLGNLIEIRWAHGARGVVNNLTKNFFAVMSFQAWRAIGGSIAVAILNLMPFFGVLFAPGWTRIGYGFALASMFGLYAGIWRRDEISPWYFFLHPVSTILFIYTILRSMCVTLWNGGVEWRGPRAGRELSRARGGTVDQTRPAERSAPIRTDADTSCSVVRSDLTASERRAWCVSAPASRAAPDTNRVCAARSSAALTLSGKE